MITSPKIRFQAYKEATQRHLDLTASDGFIEAVDYALLQFIAAAPNPNNQEEAAAGYHRILGARDFIRTLFTLADAPQKRPDPPDPNLNWKA
jgi:hypothetical protein